MNRKTESFSPLFCTARIGSRPLAPSGQDGRCSHCWMGESWAREKDQKLLSGSAFGVGLPPATYNRSPNTAAPRCIRGAGRSANRLSSSWAVAWFHRNSRISEYTRRPSVPPISSTPRRVLTAAPKASGWVSRKSVRQELRFGSRTETYLRVAPCVRALAAFHASRNDDRLIMRTDKSALKGAGQGRQFVPSEKRPAEKLLGLGGVPGNSGKAKEQTPPKLLSVLATHPLVGLAGLAGIQPRETSVPIRRARLLARGARAPSCNLSRCALIL